MRFDKWEKVRIGDLGKIITGKTPKTSIVENYGHQILFLTPSDNLASKRIYETNRMLSTTGLQEVKNCLLPAGAICVSCIGSDLGKVVITTKPTVTNQQFHSIIPNNYISSNFIYYNLVLVGRKLNILSKTSTAIPIINKTDFSNYYIYLPGLDQQKAIGETLSCLDDKIELNNRINKNLEAQAQAIFNKWFFGKDTQDNWGTLGDIADINPTRKLSKGTIARYIEMSNLASITAFPSGWEEKAYSGGSKFRNGDTLLARITPCLENGKGAYVNFLKDGEIAFGSTEYIVITGKKGYCNEFFYFLIRFLDFQLYAAKSMTGSSGRQRVSADSIASYKMPIPSLELCEKFYEIARQIMASNCNRSLENRTLSALRDTLLPKLMNGEIQIPQEV